MPLALSWPSIVGLSLAALPVGFLLFLFVVALVEKRLTYPFLLVPADRVIQVPNYVQIMSADAAAAGFYWGGTLVHRKYPQIKILGAVWMSPRREIVMLTGSGTVASMASRQTWLYTPLADGRFLVTTDQNDEGDPAGLYLTRRRHNARFPDLLALHYRRVQERYAEVRSFAEAHPFEALTGVYDDRVERLIERGRAKWTDPGREYWRHTVSGAVLVVLGFFPQLVGALTQSARVNSTPVGSNASPWHDQQVQLALGRAFPVNAPQGGPSGLMPR